MSFGNEKMARHHAQGIEHALVGDAFFGDLHIHHLEPLGFPLCIGLRMNASGGSAHRQSKTSSRSLRERWFGTTEAMAEFTVRPRMIRLRQRRSIVPLQQRRSQGFMLPRRAKGWYWLYDRGSNTLWIWEWNQPHFDLGW